MKPKILQLASSSACRSCQEVLSCPGGLNPFGIPRRRAAGWLGRTLPTFADRRVGRPRSSRGGACQGRSSGGVAVAVAGRASSSRLRRRSGLRLQGAIVAHPLLAFRRRFEGAQDTPTTRHGGRLWGSSWGVVVRQGQPWGSFRVGQRAWCRAEGRVGCGKSDLSGFRVGQQARARAEGSAGCGFRVGQRAWARAGGSAVAACCRREGGSMRAGSKARARAEGRVG